MATPAQVAVWVGLDVGKSEHFADVLDDGGERLFARAVANDQADPEALLVHWLAFYDRKKAEGKRHNSALICLARRRCDVILAMLRTRQPYQAGRKPQHGELADAA